MDREELILGCDCMSLDHVSLMIYFPPKTEEEKNDEDNVIYFTVKTRNYLNQIIPPLSIDPRNWSYDFKNYCRFHIFNRIPIAIRYIFNPSYTKKFGVLDCFDFQNKDLSKMREFLSQLTNEESEEIKFDKKSLSNYAGNIISNYLFYLDNERWGIRFIVWQLDKDMPFWLGWEIQFLPRKILGRIKYALKYIFGRVSNEQEFEINEETAKKIKGLITVVERLNKDEGN